MHTATRSQTIQERADAIALNPIYSPSGQVWLTLVEVVKATNMKQTCLCCNCLIPEFKKDSNQTKNNSHPATRNMKRHIYTSHLQQKPQWWAWTIVTDLGNSSLNKTQRLFSRFCVGWEHFPICQFAVAHQPNFGDRVTYELIRFGYVNLVQGTNTQALLKYIHFPPLIRNMSMKKKSSFKWKNLRDTQKHVKVTSGDVP